MNVSPLNLTTCWCERDSRCAWHLPGSPPRRLPRWRIVTENRCPSTRLSGAHCTRDVGHDGPHMEIADNGVTGWSQDPDTSSGGRWCGECRYGVVEDPPCCTPPTSSRAGDPNA